MLKSLIRELETAVTRLNSTTILYAEEAGILSLTNGKKVLEESLSATRKIESSLLELEARIKRLSNKVDNLEKDMFLITR